MGFLDRLNGTRRPAPETVRASAEEVRAALLALNGQEVPFAVRYGGAEGCDLLAEWRITEPAWATLFGNRQLTRTLQIRMRLARDTHEVRAVDQQREVTWVNGRPTLVEVGRGQVNTVSRSWTVGRKDDGSWGMTEEFRFNTSDMKDPLRDTVLKAGWTWRGVSFGKL
ncbi:hypothetical protein [Streptomyces sp. NPDC048442]|uniref:hypothetical protein n=1 Tax=Streptomyces sp. NPDC048442 TaxID=3154823 RepID=UPI00343ECB35